MQKPKRAVILIAQQVFYVSNIERKLQIRFEITLQNPWRTELLLSTLSNVGYFNLSYMIIPCLTSRNFISSHVHVHILKTFLTLIDK